MKSLNVESTDQFSHKNKSLPGSPDNEKSLESNKTFQESLTKASKSAATSKTNSLFGSIDCNINNDAMSRNSDEGSNGETEFDGLIYKDHNNSANTLYMLNILRKNRQLCDLILQLDDDAQDIYCHQLILACNSKFFMEIFNNYEAENNSKSHESFVTQTDQNDSEPSQLLKQPESSLRKQSVQEIVNKNHNTNHRQLQLCLSSYLRNFLSGSHHHNAKINSIISHYNHQYQNKHSHSSNHNIDMTQAGTQDDETINHINKNLDHQALKICIDYMYTSKLKVPSHLLPHVYTLAYHLSIENIVQACAQYLMRLLNVDNCLSIRSFALDEDLIKASSECIESNIEYILQLKPISTLTSRGSVGSSLSSLMSSSNTKLNGNNFENNELTQSYSTLSSTLNIANKEFNHLPRIQIELIGLKNQKLKLPESIDILTQLSIDWLVQESCEKHRDLPELTEQLNMLYINADSTLHDCCDMESTDCNFDDYIDDYQKRHNVLGTLVEQGNSAKQTNNHKKRKNKKKQPTVVTPSSEASNRLKTFTITDQELNNIGTATPIKFKVLHDNEVICTHQTSESSFITISTLNGNLVTLSVHLSKKIQKGSSENEIFNNAEISFSNETNQFETRGRIPSNKSDVSELSLTVDSQFPLDYLTNNNLNKSPMILFNRSLSSNSTSDSEKIPRMAIARCSHGVVSYENRLYIIGGYDRGECLNLCEVYDPITNSLTTMEPMTNRRGRAAITFFEKENSIFVVGGSDGHEDLNSIEYFNMNEKKWNCTTFDFELACSNLATASCKQFIYLVGLKSDSKKSLSRTSCLKYEPKLNQFTRMCELNQGRSQAGLVYTSVNMSYDNQNTEKSDLLFVFGGHDQIRCLNSCEVYNIKDDKWKLISNMHEPKRGCGATVHQETNTIYIVGGTNGTQSLKSVEIYNILSQKWTRGPELNLARTNVAIAFIGNNLFALGGFDGKSFLRTIEYLNINNLDAGWTLFHKQNDFC